MPVLVRQPSRIEAAGTKPKRIEEYIGRVSSATESVSVAKMSSPGGWEEPGQRPDFDEFTVVVKGSLRVEHEAAPARIFMSTGYSTPSPEGAEYFAVCLPAFSPDTVHRDE